MVALVLLGALALLIGGAVLYAKYGKKAKAEEVKLSDFAKTEVKKADEVVNNLHDEVKNAEAKIGSDVKNVEADVKKVL